MDMNIELQEICNGYVIMAGHDAGMTTDQIKDLLNKLQLIYVLSDKHHAQAAYDGFVSQNARDRYGRFII